MESSRQSGRIMLFPLDRKYNIYTTYQSMESNDSSMKFEDCPLSIKININDT